MLCAALVLCVGFYCALLCPLPTPVVYGVYCCLLHWKWCVLLYSQFIVLGMVFAAALFIHYAE